MRDGKKKNINTDNEKIAIIEKTIAISFPLASI
jgi:hypothetical protein